MKRTCKTECLEPFFNDEISQMIVSIVGDYKVPLPETIYLIGKILKRLIQNIIFKAQSISDLRESSTIDLEDFIFVFRNNKVRLKRMYDFLAFDKSMKDPEDFDNTTVLNNSVSSAKRVRTKSQFSKFLINVVDTQNGLNESRVLLNQPALFDQNKHNQLMRLDKQYKQITDEQYVELVNLKHLSYKNLSQKRYQKLKASLEIDKFKPMNEICGDVIGFLFRELLNEIVESALEVKAKQKESSRFSSSKKLSNITSNEIYESFRVYAIRNETRNDFITTNNSCFKKFLLL